MNKIRFPGIKKYKLDLPHAVILQAIKDLRHPDEEIREDAERFLESGGGFWAEYTTLDVDKIYQTYKELYGKEE